MKTIKLILGASILLFASSVQASTLTVSTTIDGLDWAGLKAWKSGSGDVLTLCGDSGLCNGVTSAGTDLTGWHWANESEAINLMNNILGSSLPTTYIGDTSSWFDIFGQTAGETGAKYSAGLYFDWESYGPGPIDFSNGLLSFTSFIGSVYSRKCSDGELTNPNPVCIPSEFVEKAIFTTSNSFWETQTGVYLLWKPSPIPIPAAVWLFGTALIGLFGFSRRRKAA